MSLQLIAVGTRLSCPLYYSGATGIDIKYRGNHGGFAPRSNETALGGDGEMGRWGEWATDARCLMPDAQCPMPDAQCPMPNAQCPFV